MRYWLLIFVLLAGSVQADSTIIQNTTDVKDSYIFSTSADANYHTEDSLFIHLLFGTIRHTVISLENLENHVDWPTETPTKCSVYFFCDYISGTDDATLHVIAKPPYLPNVTYNDWYTTDSEWTTAGIGNTCDPITYNRGDGTGCDRGSVVIDGPEDFDKGAWTGFEIDTSYINGYLRDDHDQLYFRLHAPTNISEIRTFSSDFGGDTLHVLDTNGSTNQDFADYMVGMKFYIPFGCTVDSINVFVGNTKNRNHKGILYNFDGSDSSHIVTSVEKAAAIDTGWTMFVFSGGQGVPGNKNYLLGVWGDGGASNVASVWYKTSGGTVNSSGIFYIAADYASPEPDPFRDPTTLDADGQLCMTIHITDSSNHAPYFIVYKTGAAAEINAIHEVGAGGVIHSVGTAGSAIHEP
jgi:hypothetical protein